MVYNNMDKNNLKCFFMKCRMRDAAVLAFRAFLKMVNFIISR